MNETIAVEGKAFEIESNGQTWRVTWHEGQVAPDGKPHGSLGICSTESYNVVLVSTDGEQCYLPIYRRAMRVAGLPAGIPAPSAHRKPLDGDS